MLQPTTEELLARIETLEGRQRTQGRRRGARMALSVVALAALLAVPIGVFASHSFTDVPDSNTFHTQIGRVKGAGITAGCTATTYCPDANVTRGQMAAFLARTGGRAAHQQFDNTTMPTGAALTNLASVTIKPGDVTGGTAYVKFDATLSGYVTAVTGCPCAGVFYPYVNGVSWGRASFVTISDVNYGLGLGLDTISITGLVAVPTGVAATIEVRGFNAYGTESMVAFGHLVATYVPFASDGTNAVVSAAPAPAPKPGPLPDPLVP